MLRRLLFAFLTMFAACAGTSTPAFAQVIPALDSAALPRLPGLPPFVWSPTGPVPVLRTNPVPCGPIVGALACFHQDSLVREIIVSDTLPLLAAWFALEHERVHLQLRDEGVGFQFPEVEEAVASAIARQRLYALLYFLRQREHEHDVTQVGAPRAP